MTVHSDGELSCDGHSFAGPYSSSRHSRASCSSSRGSTTSTARRRRARLSGRRRRRCPGGADARAARSPRQTPSRTSGWSQPISPVNTSASSRSRLVAAAAISRLTRWTNTSSASAAAGRRRGGDQVAGVARPAVRQPEQPRAVLQPVAQLLQARAGRRPAATAACRGRRCPDRLLIGTPSSGVNPIEVSTLRPSRTAHTEEPPPRWVSTRCSSAAGRPSSSAARPSAQA